MTRAPRSSRHSAALRQTSYAYRFAAGYAPFYAAINMFGNRRWMSEIGKRGGAARTPAKAAAARTDGRQGGRPRKDASPNGISSRVA